MGTPSSKPKNEIFREYERALKGQRIESAKTDKNSVNISHKI